MCVTDTPWAVLEDEGGKTFVVELVDQNKKIKGIGVFNPVECLTDVPVGSTVPIGQKSLLRLPPRLPELNRGMMRRAQTIGSKDAGFFITRLGLGPGDVVVEAGIGSAGLSLHIARVLGSTGTHITVEPRAEHAAVGLENMQRARANWPQFPRHHHLEGRIEDVVPSISSIAASVDAIVLDLPDHPPAIQATAGLLKSGGRLACYCPVTSQLERAWEACEAAGLDVEWAGELMEREWGRASKGGVRPVNGPFGHTAFLLVAQRRS
jgi:tRNA (adenine57-N1/adenine58-N1)-methyltransferase